MVRCRQKLSIWWCRVLYLCLNRAARQPFNKGAHRQQKVPILVAPDQGMPYTLSKMRLRPQSTEEEKLLLSAIFVRFVAEK